jgi:fluoride exporter
LDKAFLVGAGGFLGSVLRYLVGGVVQSAVAGSTFPYGTLVVNATGCFAIGLVSQLVEAQGAFSSAARAFLVVGFLGGYTTFSAFGNETVNLMRDGQRVAAVMNVGGQLVLALCAVWLGRLTAHLIWR